MMRLITLALALVLFCVGLPARADDIVYPYVFTNGQVLPAGQLNGNFDAITDEVNGNLTNENLSASAAVELSKLDLTAIALNLRASGNPTWASGVTGDTVPRITLYSTGWLAFGAGSASAVDIILKRTDANTLAIRNFADNADKNLTAGALTLSTPLVVGSGGTGAATASGYTVFSNTTSGSAAPAFATLVTEQLPAGTKSFGGYGSSTSWRALPAMSGVVSLTGDYVNYGNFTDAAATSITFNKFRLFNKGTITITKVWTGTTECAGGTGSSVNGMAGHGAGLGGGNGGYFISATVHGGAGGGHGGVGGNGGSGTAGFVNVGGGTYGYEVLLSGSGGGGGCGAATSGSGGNGGASCYIESTGSIFVSGTITADGAAGTAGSANGCGGGGGSGGTIALVSNDAIDLTGGTLNARGGAGGNQAGTGGAGGGGGGGVVWGRCRNAYTAGTIAVTGGGAGTGGTSTATAGASGVSDIVGSAAYPGRSAP